MSSGCKIIDQLDCVNYQLDVLNGQICETNKKLDKANENLVANGKKQDKTNEIQTLSLRKERDLKALDNEFKEVLKDVD